MLGLEIIWSVHFPSNILQSLHEWFYFELISCYACTWFVCFTSRSGIFRSDRNAVVVGEGLQNLGICSAASALICAGRYLYLATPAVTLTESRVWSPFMTSKGY